MSFTVRHVKFSDLPRIEALAEQEHYDEGMELLEINYKQSGSGWWLVENDEGQVVFYHAVNEITRDIAHGYCMVTDRRYRGHGLSKLTPNAVGKPKPQKIFGGNSSKDNLMKLMSFRPGRFKWAINDLSGPVDLNVLANLNCPEVQGTTVVFREDGYYDKKMIEYDKHIINLNRGKYLKALWNAKSCVATALAISSKGQIQGFGTIWRINQNEMQVQAFYADSEPISGVILVNLLRKAARSQSFTDLLAPVVSDKFIVRSILHRLGLRPEARFVQMHKPAGASFYDKIDISKVYAVNYYWPV